MMPNPFALHLLTYRTMIAILLLAMTGVVMAHAPEVKEDYDTRWRKLPERATVRPVDPNVYVYNAKFQRNFLMPPEWTSTELRNVDAVAMRVVADYGSCSWDDARQGCELVALRCEIDLYFDNNDHVLPWRAEAPEFWDSNYWSSTHFLRKASRDAGRSVDLALPSTHPFSSQQSGKPMVRNWRLSAPGKDRRRMELLSYDRAALKSTARVSLAVPCEDPPAALVLASEESNDSRKDGDPWTISLPQSWQGRVADAIRNAAAIAQDPSRPSVKNK